MESLPRYHRERRAILGVVLKLNLTSVWVLAVWILASGSELAVAQTNTIAGTKSERLKAEVLKVYQAQDGPALFRAYVIKWNDQEVIVSDRLATTSYRVGDLADVMVMRHEFRGEEGASPILSFQVVPAPRTNRVVSFKHFSQTAPQRAAKTPSYLDCQPDKVVIYPGKDEVGWSELQQATNAVTRLLDKVQKNSRAEYVVVLVRPQAVKNYRQVRRLVGQRPVDVAYEPVDGDFKVDWNEATKAGSAPVLPVAPAGRGGEQATFFECRGDEVFFIDKAGLDGQIAKALAAPNPGPRNPKAFLQVLKEKDLGNESYRVKSEDLMTAILALEPRGGATGDGAQQLQAPDSRFQKALAALDPQRHNLAFLVREDSFGVFREARALAGKRGFTTGWELLGPDEPIKFGSGGVGLPAR